MYISDIILVIESVSRRRDKQALIKINEINKGGLENNFLFMFVCGPLYVPKRA